MQVYSTSSVPVARRTAYWNSLYEQFAPVSIRPACDAPFHAELQLGRIGPLEFALVSSDAARAVRTKEQAARMADRQFGVIVQLEGESVWWHCGQEHRLTPGDILLSDNTQAIASACDAPVRSVTVRARAALLRAHIPFIDEICGVRLPARSGFARAAAAIATCLAEQGEAGVTPEYETTIANHFLDIVATSFAMETRRAAPETSVANVRKSLARQYIEAHLAAPELTPQNVAEALHISPRYLRMLMAEDGETASAVILRRRLEECAKQLSSPLWRDRTITQIAFSWGFNSTAHFARVFRDKFGVSPRDYRYAAIEQDQRRP